MKPLIDFAEHRQSIKSNAPLKGLKIFWITSGIALIIAAIELLIMVSSKSIYENQHYSQIFTFND